jgi:glycosyltransferase involved in cell wall biosynthesis
MKVAIVTPTIGKPELNDALKSVQNQTYKDITHYVFIDGMEYEEHIWKMQVPKNVKFVRLDENVGKGWYGHRVYAACSFLVNADIIVYLDEDNWIEPCHVEKLVNKINEGNDWAYSLRKIYDKDGNFLCEDNCESLGKWPVYFNGDAFHIDTSSFAIRRDVAVRVGHSWYGQWGADRQFFGALKKYFPKYDCTNAHTLCYRLDGNPNSVTKEFFENGNTINQQKYNGEFPWKSKQHSLQVAPGISVVF